MQVPAQFFVKVTDFTREDGASAIEGGGVRNARRRPRTAKTQGATVMESARMGSAPVLPDTLDQRALKVCLVRILI